MLVTRSQLQISVEQVKNKYNHIDVLCINTGIYPSHPIESMLESDWDHVNNVNLKGTFFDFETLSTIT